MASRMKADNKHSANHKEAQNTPASSTDGKGRAGSGGNQRGDAPNKSAAAANHRQGAPRTPKVPTAMPHSGTKKPPQTQHEGKSAVILSAAVFVLCMACLAAGFYLSTPTPQSEDTTDIWQPPPDQDSSSQIPQKNQLPPVAQDSAAANTPLLTATPVPAVETTKEDSFVPQAQNSAPVEPLTQNVADNAATEVKSSVQAIKPDQAMILAQSSSAAAKSKYVARAEDETTPSLVKQGGDSSFDIPPAQNGAVLVFIIDDGGYSTAHLEKYTSLPFPLAVAVLPRLPHSVQCAQIVRSSGQELMLHQPMQAKNLSVYPGEGALLPSMSAAEIYDTVVANLREIAPVRGMNNHEGSLITADALKIAAVLDATKDAGVYFLDSRTSADTVAPQVAEEKGIKILQRDVFIDDIISEEEMLKQILRALDIANKNGQAVMIGHVDKSAAILPSLLKRMHPELVRQGYSFAFPSELLR